MELSHNRCIRPDIRGAHDAFFAKVDFVGSPSRLMFSSFLGGSSTDAALAVASAGFLGSVTVAGATASSDFPTLFPLDTADVRDDAFITTFLMHLMHPVRANTTGTLGVATKIGIQSAGPAHRPSVSNSGGELAFHSPAADFASLDGVNDTNGVGDVYLHDVDSGTMQLVSKNQYRWGGQRQLGFCSGHARWHQSRVSVQRL